MVVAAFDRQNNNSLGTITANVDGIIGIEKEDTERYGILEVPDEIGWDVVGYVVNKTEDGFIYSQERRDMYDALTREDNLKRIRQLRDEKLKDSDKYALVDWPHATPEIKQSWLEYRQALRDITITIEDPMNPTWPIQPSP